MKRCNESEGKIICDDCNNEVNENKKFEANSSLIKRYIPNQFGQMLPF